METKRQEAQEVQNGSRPALPANTKRAPACNASVLVRQALVMDSPCEGPEEVALQTRGHGHSRQPGT